LKKESERGRKIKGGAKDSNTDRAYWPAPLLSGTWAMACEFALSRDLKSADGQVTVAQIYLLLAMEFLPRYNKYSREGRNRDSR
jgi:hypothetical protein